MELRTACWLKRDITVREQASNAVEVSGICKGGFCVFEREPYRDRPPIAYLVHAASGACLGAFSAPEHACAAGEAIAWLPDDPQLNVEAVSAAVCAAWGLIGLYVGHTADDAGNLIWSRYAKKAPLAA